MQSAPVLGPNSWNSIVPAGADPPVRVAVSVTVALPRLPAAAGVVERAGTVLAAAPARARAAVALGLLAVAVSVAWLAWPGAAGVV